MTARIHQSAIIGFSAMTGTEDSDSVHIKEGVVICPNVVIGHECTLEKNSFFDIGVKIGDRTTIGESTRVINWARIHEDCIVGSNCIISGTLPERSIVGRNVRHFGRIVHDQTSPYSDWLSTEEPTAKLLDGCFVGAEAMLIGDITIGCFSFVAAGEIVRRSVPDFHVYYKGNCIKNSEWQGRLKVPKGINDPIISSNENK